MDVHLSRAMRLIDVTMIGVGIEGGGDRHLTEQVGPLHG